MTFLSILSGLLRAVGFFEQADKMWEAHLAKVKAQEVANAPQTNDEEADYLRK